MRRRKSKFQFDVRHQIDVVPVHRKSNLFRSPYQPLCHQFRGTSNSSVRVDIAKHILLNECHLTKTGLVGNRVSKYRHDKMKKIESFHQLKLSDVSTYDAKISTMFITDTVDPFFDSRKRDLQLLHNVHFLKPTSLMVFDSDDGCCHNLSTFPTFVKLPRAWSLEKRSNIKKDTATLQRFLKGKKITRGNSHLDVSQNYATFGFFCSRNSRQVLKKEDLATCTISENDVQQLLRMYTRANDLAMRVLPTELLRGLRAAQQFIQWPTMETNRRPIADPALHSRTSINLWAGAAVSMNYVSATHVDSDFFIQC
jgi:hypothetical protein